MRYQASGTRKRIMAGAACPACQQQDCVQLFVSADDEWIECVECGHQERRPDPAQLAQMQQADPADPSVQVVKLIRPG